ncbi:hypothetical protein [Helicobacter turcicus]|uniref:Uncharacterized protein n=1 Tax=Helicobacter turcicus TaxID=2867412 RepID=A0ABS7JMZ1_9HELI|nr:hypothetical protein [Helicobacter turcicus]MBX7490762.1 hypothetical protein [Helicobacter turcicus]MBX7545629.1 hypothetical protein [Helicobacter turcicus]
MNLSRLIRPLFPTIIVGIEIDHKICNVVAHFYKSGQLVSSQSKEFRANPGELPMQAVRFIQKIRAKDPFTYISVLPCSIIQGVLNTDKEEEFKNFGVNCAEVAYKRFDNNWSVFVANEGIAETKKRFLKLGADFVISPFLVLYRLAKDTFQDSCKLYVLFQHSNITMLITKRNCGALFGGYYVLESEIDSELTVVRNSLSEDDDDIQKTNIEKDLQDELSDIEEVDLSNDATDDELIEVLKNNEEDDEKLHTESENSEDLDDFSRVNTAAKFIQSALNEFYSNSLYNSEFISEVVIFNPHNIRQETLQQIQQITMLEVSIFSCDIAQELANLGYDSYQVFEAKGEV